MKILNLTDLEKSEIKYKISKFPDGQQNIVISNDSIQLANQGSHHIQIKSRLNNFLDLELIICTMASLREYGVSHIHLYTPYFMGARSDRQFEEGGNRYLKDVICPIINSLKLSSVTVLDPHSTVLENLLNNFKKVDNKEIVKFALRDIINNSNRSGSNIEDHCIIISPDAGATHKIYKLAQDVDYKGEIITCIKERDKDGKLSKVFVPMNKIHDTHKDIIIIDDICDGGATFINIAKEIKDKYFNSKIYLIVTHGIFSKGFDDLFEYFDHIYCTNSYNNIEKYEDPLYYEAEIKPGIRFVKQLNVF